MARGNTSTPQPPNELELLKAQVETLKESVKSLTTALGKKRGTEPTLSFDTLSIEHTGEYHKFGSWMDTFLAKLNRWKIDDVPLRRVLLSHDENLSEGFDDSQAGAISSEAQSQVFDLFNEVLAGIPRATYNSFKKTSRDPRRFWEQLKNQYLSKDPVQVNHLLEKIENLKISMREDGIRTVAQFETLETELVRRGRTLSEEERLRIFQRMISANPEYAAVREHYTLDCCTRGQPETATGLLEVIIFRNQQLMQAHPERQHPQHAQVARVLPVKSRAAPGRRGPSCDRRGRLLDVNQK